MSHIYLAYRIYENKDMSFKDSVLIGWTKHKNVIKSFMAQRDKKKYNIYKVDKSDIKGKLEKDNRIDALKIQSAKDGKEYLLFITPEELQEAENNIQYMIKQCMEFSRITNDNDIETYVDMYCNLLDEYLDALELIGYVPVEVESIGCDAYYEDDGSLESTLDQINIAYTKDNKSKVFNRPPGMNTIKAVSKLIIYSLESFIMALKDDM